MLLPQQPAGGCSWGHSAVKHHHFLPRKRLVTSNRPYCRWLLFLFPLRFAACDEAFLCVFPLSDIAQLEQDTVLGVQSLLMLCSQDSSPSAQATLKVRRHHDNMIEIEEIQRGSVISTIYIFFLVIMRVVKFCLVQGVDAVKHFLLRHKITHKLSILLYCCHTGAKVNAI